MPRFTDKHVLITGATSGIGLAGAQRIASEGGRLTLTGTDPHRISAVQDALPDAVVIDNDAGDPSACLALAASVSGGQGLDGLWLNAGYAALSDVDDVNADAFDRMMNVNVRGPMLQLAALSEHLNQGASVVVTSSTATYDGSPMTSVYAATKGALVAAARSWASALADRGIRVNTLVPGPIESNLRSFLSEDARQEFEAAVVSQVPLGRVGRADEAAAVALFLLSDDASYVTASQYPVDGGLIKQ